MSIHWCWAIFLAVQMLVSCLFLAATMYRTAVLQTPVLKSSALATLIASTEEVRSALEAAEGGMGETNQKARGVVVTLRDGRLILA